MIKPLIEILVEAGSGNAMNIYDAIWISEHADVKVGNMLCLRAEDEPILNVL